MNIGATNSAARWLTANINTIPTHHTHAIVEVFRGEIRLVASGSLAECCEVVTDPAARLLCELDTYRAHAK